MSRTSAQFDFRKRVSLRPRGQAPPPLTCAAPAHARRGARLRAIRRGRADPKRSRCRTIGKHGLILAIGDPRDCFVAVDQAGGHHALNKKLTRLTLAKIRAWLLPRRGAPRLSSPSLCRRSNRRRLVPTALSLPPFGFAMQQL
jgi:hypothetical protein